MKAKDIRYSRKTPLDDIERSEGCYILRKNRYFLDADKVWKYYMKLVEIERSFRTMKSSLGINPIYHSNLKNSLSFIFHRKGRIISSRFSGLTIDYTSLPKNSVLLSFLYKFLFYMELTILFAAVMNNIG